MNGDLSRSAAFCGLGLLLFVLLFLVSDRVDPVFAELRMRDDILKQRSEQIRVVAAGNSHSRAVHLGTLGVPGFNVWRDGADLYEAAYLLRAYVPRLPSLECVLLPASYHLLTGDNAVVEGRDRTAARVALYATTSSWHWMPGDFHFFVQAKLAPVIRRDEWKGVWLALAGRAPQPSRVDRDGWIGDRVRAGRWTADALEASTRRVHEEKPPFPYDHPDYERRRASAARALREMAAFLAARDVNLVLYTPPYYHVYTELMDPRVVADVRREAQRVAATYPNVVYLDHATDSSFVHTPTYFLNGDHLAEIGAVAYSKKLWEQAGMYCQTPGGTDAE